MCLYDMAYRSTNVERCSRPVSYAFAYSMVYPNSVVLDKRQTGYNPSGGDRSMIADKTEGSKDVMIYTARYRCEIEK